MPQVRYFTVDIHVQVKVDGVSDSGGELTHSEAVQQALAKLRSTPSLRHGIEVGNITVTETFIGGSPIVRDMTTRTTAGTMPVPDANTGKEGRP
jgi:hypothetical protein